LALRRGAVSVCAVFAVMHNRPVVIVACTPCVHSTKRSEERAGGSQWATRARNASCPDHAVPLNFRMLFNQPTILSIKIKRNKKK
jgi:hypothetical protein